MDAPRFYVDLDDVLADTTHALVELARTRFDRDVDFESMEVFDLSVSLGLDENDFPAFMNAAHEPGFLLGLGPIPGARDTLDHWRSGGIKIDVITGRPPASRAATLAWLGAQRIPFDTLEFVDKYARHGDPSATTPGDLCDRGLAVVVEDADETADFLALHTDALVLLYDRPWNRNSMAEAHGALRVRSWNDVRKIVDARA